MISKFQKGFSLVELLVVIAIIGILAAVGITAYSGYTKNAKAKAAISQFSQVEAVINAELARCAVGEGNMVWGTAATEQIDAITAQMVVDAELVPGAVPGAVAERELSPAVPFAADACGSFPPNHTNIVAYVNTGLPDSLGMTNPYNADEPFATVGSRDTQASVLGGLTIFCGMDDVQKCQLEVLHKVSSGANVFENTEILEY